MLGAPSRTALGRQRFAHDRDRHAVHEHPGVEGVTDAPVAAWPARGVNPSHQDAASPMSSVSQEIHPVLFVQDYGSATLAVRALPAPGQTHVNEMERRSAPNQHDGPREAPRLPGALPHGSRQPGPPRPVPLGDLNPCCPVGRTPFYLIRAVPTALVDSNSTRTEPCVSTRPDPEPQVRLPRRKATDCN